MQYLCTWESWVTYNGPPNQLKANGKLTSDTKHYSKHFIPYSFNPYQLKEVIYPYSITEETAKTSCREMMIRYS